MSTPTPARLGDPTRGADLTARLDEQLLVERVRAGDPLAFEAIFRRYHDELCRVAEGVVRSRSAAEDVVQDVFLTIWASRGRWEVAVSVRAYLRRAARNMALRRATRLGERGREPLEGTELADPAPSPHEQLEAAAAADAVARATDRLPPRMREVYRLQRDDGLTVGQIAARLGIAVKTVEMHLARARAALRSALAAWRA